MIVDPVALRRRPDLVRELRTSPGEYVERRFAPLHRVEARAAENADGYRLGGLAAVFDEMSVNLGGFREVIKRGAFKKVLKKDPDVRCLFNHDLNLLLGRTAAGTLRLQEVPKGLDYEADAPATSYAADLRVLMERGDVTQSSFAFRIAPGGDEWDEDPETGALIRTIHEFGELYDVSPVTDPAYPAATSGLRHTPLQHTETDEQPVPEADAQERGTAGESDAHSEQDQEPLQGEQPYLLAARQRRLRQLALIARS